MSDFMKVLIDFPIYWHRKKYNKENYHNIDHVKLFEYKTMVNNLKWILVKIHLYLHVLKTVRKYHIFFRFVLENMSIYAWSDTIRTWQNMHCVVGFKISLLSAYERYTAENSFGSESQISSRVANH